MFGFLKKKLKEAVSKFSRRVEEEVKPEEKVVEETPVEEVKPGLEAEPKETAEKQETTKPEKTEKPKERKEAEAKEAGREKEKVSEELEEKEETGVERVSEETKLRKAGEEELKESESLEESKPSASQKSVGIVTEKENVEDKLREKSPKVEAVTIPKKKSMFGRLKDIVTKKTLSDEEFGKLFWNIELVLLENNVALEVIEKIRDDLKEKLVGKKIFRGGIQKTIEESLKHSIKEILSIKGIDIIDRIKSKEEKPFVCVFLGINGSGKTTTIAKLAYLLKREGISSVIAAGDTFRAAAIQQLEEHANKLGIKLIKHDYGADSAAVAYDAIEYAKAHRIDTVLVDTAGRLHSNKNLMEELKKIIRVTRPDLKIFVGESITGNDCVKQAESFDREIGIDSIILTKADVDDKGGAALSISYVTQKPIIFIGTGQGYTDLSHFDPEKIEESLFA